jgi:hypothetical protein
MANPTGLDLASILSSTADTITDLASGAVSLQKNASSSEQIANDVADAQTKIGQNSALIENAKQTAALATQNARLKAANTFGTNIADQGEKITALSNTINQQYVIKQDALAEIARKHQTSFLDDPLEWIINRYSVNDDIDRANDADAQLNAATRQMQELNVLTSSTIAVQNAIDQPITESSIAASTDNIARNAQIQADQAKLAGLKYNTEGIQAALNTSKEINSLKFSAFGAAAQQQNIEIALANLALHQQEFDWKKEEKKKGEDADSLIIDQINKGRQIRMGANADLLVPGSPKASQVIGLLKSGSPIGKQFQDDYFAGENGILATSPAKALDIVSTLPTNLSPAQIPVVNLIKSAGAELYALADKPGSGVTLAQLKNPAERDALINARVKQLLDEQAKNIKPGDPDNVYNIGSLRANIGASPVLQSLPVVQKVLAPAIDAGLDTSDPNKVFATVAQALKSGQLNYKEALELVTVYHVAVDTNLAAKNFPNLGLPPVYSYKTSIQTQPNAAFGGKEIVDLTKADLVGRAFNKYLANAAASTASMFTDPGTFTNPNTPNSNFNLEAIRQARKDNMPLPDDLNSPNIYNDSPEYWKRVREAQAAARGGNK